MGRLGRFPLAHRQEVQGHDMNPGRTNHAVNHSYGIPSFPLTIPRAEMQCLFSSDPTRGGGVYSKVTLTLMVQ